MIFKMNEEQKLCKRIRNKNNKGSSFTAFNTVGPPGLEPGTT
ncbi:MAG: hypothetical protein SNJ64_03135 [Endomicrobiia bacterium]